MDAVPISYDLIDLTFNVASATGADVFSIYDRDAEEIIEIINYIILRGKKTSKAIPETTPERGKDGLDKIWSYI